MVCFYESFISNIDFYFLLISFADENYYKTGIIWCRDGSKSFSSKYLNDDFCDCGDGTDEPGKNSSYFKNSDLVFKCDIPKFE